MIDKEIWDKLNKLNEDTYFDRIEGDHQGPNLTAHEFHKVEFGLENKGDYNEVAHAITSQEASPIGENMDWGIVGYINQDGRNVKFARLDDNKYMIGVYVGSPTTGAIITFYTKNLQDILKDADPYNRYSLANKEGDYRYKCDLDKKFEGLKFFNNHPEYHRDTSEERVREIKGKLYKSEKLGNFNTDRE